MIPELNAQGYLPPGIHRATLSELEDKFGRSTAKRREIMLNLHSLIELLEKHRHHVLRLLIDGSFITSKPYPGDVDMILVLSKVFDFDSDEAARLRRAKADLNVHLITLTEEDALEIAQALAFFGHDRAHVPKGLLEVST
jgi:hypothetical protein